MILNPNRYLYKLAYILIGCYGDGKKWALAETITAFAWALDASTVSAISNDIFATSYQNLARGLPRSKLYYSRERRRRMVMFFSLISFRELSLCIGSGLGLPDPKHSG